MSKSAPSPATPTRSQINTARICTFLCLIGGLFFAAYLLIASIYIPYLRINNQLFNRGVTITLLSIHVILLFFICWSYLCVRFTNPGNIPCPRRLTANDLHALESGHLPPFSASTLLSSEFTQVQQDGYPLYCSECQTPIPSRTAHCKETNRCVSKFDHYCPWLSSAIGCRNHKYFMQFVFYLTSLTIYLQAIGIVAIVELGPSAGYLVLVILSSIIADLGLIPMFLSNAYCVFNDIISSQITGSSFMCGNQESPVIWVSCNLIDYFDRYGLQCQPFVQRIVVPLKIWDKPWKQGYRQNWSKVMGRWIWEWILPIPPMNRKKEWWNYEFNNETKKVLRSCALAKYEEILLGNGETTLTFEIGEVSEDDSTEKDCRQESVALPPRVVVR